MIGVVQYGSGNISAILNIYSQLNVRCKVVADRASIESVDKYILPGVGHFDTTMSTLNGNGALPSLAENVIGNGKTLLGICVGMQVLADSSEEGAVRGLGWIAGRVKRIATTGDDMRLPHMGWNSIEVRSQDERLFRGVDPSVGFYFLHSYRFDVTDAASILATTTYGETFACAVSNSRNIFGVQFHPEKSHRNGLMLLKNFAEL